jgi:hypothetical protein
LKKGSIAVIIVSFVITIILIGTIVTLLLMNSHFVPPAKNSGDVFSGEESGEAPVEEEVVVEEVYTGPKVFSGDSRSVAIMIDNDNKSAWPHAGLNNAYMIYEIIVEGGSTRFISFFKKDNLPEKVGPIRSARHYFLDYVQEHDAIYCHFGWSPLAQKNIPKLNIDNINGIYDTYYWREAPKSSYHNAFSSKELIEKFIAKKKYRDYEKQDCIVSFNEKDTDLTDVFFYSGDTMSAQTIKFKYSSAHTTSYEYDPETKTYLRSMRGVEHTDRFTKERFYAKNIIAYKVKDVLLPDVEDKGRRELYNTGSGEGYYFTNGSAIKIKWSKSTHSSRTIYEDMYGNELKLNDGITWVQIIPSDYGTISFE